MNAFGIDTHGPLVGLIAGNANCRELVIAPSLFTHRRVRGVAIMPALKFVRSVSFVLILMQIYSD
jgi:hypothetical protein